VYRNRTIKTFTQSLGAPYDFLMPEASSFSGFWVITCRTEEYGLAGKNLDFHFGVSLT
jgi:hypothetical protein